MPDSRVVVFDTNVLIPLILPASLSVRLLSRLRSAGWHIALSPQIMEEVRDKMLHKQTLRNWLELSDAEIVAFLDRGLLGKIEPYQVHLKHLARYPTTHKTTRSLPLPWKPTPHTSSRRTSTCWTSANSRGLRF